MTTPWVDAAIDSIEMRRAGPDLLALALMDARNHTLNLFSHYETALAAADFRVPLQSELNPPLWELGHIAWFQEWWIGRNSQRHWGSGCQPAVERSACLLAQADRWWDSSNVAHDSRWALGLPDLAATKAYLQTSLDITLELLEPTPHEDDALYFYRLALFHEDMHGEALICMAQTLGFTLDLVGPQSTAPRPPIGLPAQRWQLGSPAASGFIFDNEKSLHEVVVPEFEIDAQAVNWSQFAEFVQDGGYDRPELWNSRGWDWLQGKQVPRHVAQIGGTAVIQTRFGQERRMAGNQAASHLSWWEADAWCRWAGRRLPTEVEWELAAHKAERSGFRWGEVWEWTGSSFQPYPGFVADPYLDYSQPWFGSHRVLRGGSWATRARMKSAKYRNFYLSERNDIFSGFRSCSL